MALTRSTVAANDDELDVSGDPVQSANVVVDPQ